MNNNEEFRFVAELSEDLGSNKISLPSLPTVVLKIRSLLEQDDCDFEQVSNAVRADPALVSRLMQFANSAYHNPSGEPIKSLDAAIGRLGFELVRSTALSMAIQQAFLADEHKGVARHLQRVWSRSLRLACMAFAITSPCKELSEETAFMCGIMHEIGKLYVLTKAKSFPTLFNDEASLNQVLETWYTPIGTSIVEAWKFDEEMCLSMNPIDNINDRRATPPTMADVMHVARLLVARLDGNDVDLNEALPCIKLGVTEDKHQALVDLYKDKEQTIRQTFAAAA